MKTEQATIRLKHLFLASSILLTPTVAAHAQTQAQAQTQNFFEEIIVTAQKREQSLQEVPISLTVMQGQEIERLGAVSFDDLDGYVPNLTVAETPSTNIIIMRGIGSGSGSLSLEQSVVMFVDGVYGGRARQFQTPFLDLERIEVLRGPQGALVGKNTSAGAINIISAKPTQDFMARVSGDYDFTLDGGSTTAVVSGPISENFGVRVAAKYDNYGGYLYNTITDRKDPSRENITLRGTAAYNTDTLEILGKVEYSKFENAGQPLQVASRKLGRQFDRTKESGSSAGDEFDETEAINAVLTINLDVADHTLTSISALSEYTNHTGIDADFFERDLAYAEFNEDFKQYSQEIRLVSPSAKTIEYVVGGYYHNAKLEEMRTTNTLFAPAANTLRDFDQESNVLSVFGQLTWNFSDVIRATGSVRYTYEKKTGDFILYRGAQAIPGRIGTTLAFDDRLTENQVDPSISVQWDMSDEAMLYASYARGSKGGGFQGAISNAAFSTFQFKPEKSESFEAGAKITLGGSGFINVAAYYTEYSDLQLSVALATTGASGFDFFTSNAGKARARGIEVDGLYYFTQNLKLQGSASFLDGEYTDYANGPCSVGRPNDAANGQGCNLTGAPLPYAPKWSGNMTLSYEQPISSSLVLNLSGTASYRSKSTRDQANDPAALQKGFAKLDVSAGVSDADDRWRLSLMVKNLTNKETFGFSSPAALANNPVFGISDDVRAYVMDLPRTVAVQATVNF